MVKKSGNYDLLEWSRTMAGTRVPESQEETFSEYEPVHEPLEDAFAYDEDDVHETQPEEEVSRMEMAFPGTADEVEELVRSKASEYREKHYPGVDPQRVRWNKEGAEEVIEIVKRAVREIPGVQKKALAEAVGTTYLTLGKWLEGEKKAPKAEAKPRQAAVAALSKKTPPSTPVKTEPKAEESILPKSPTASPADLGDDQLCFDIEKVQDGRLRIYLSPKGLKSFINSI